MAPVQSALMLVALTWLVSCVEFVPVDRRLTQNDVTLACGGARVEIACVSSPEGLSNDPEAGRCNRNDASLRTPAGREIALPPIPKSTVFADPRSYAPKGAACYALGTERAIAIVYSNGRRECAKCAARDYYRLDGERLPEANTFVLPIARGSLKPSTSVWVGGDE